MTYPVPPEGLETFTARGRQCTDGREKEERKS